MLKSERLYSYDSSSLLCVCVRVGGWMVVLGWEGGGWIHRGERKVDEGGGDIESRY